MTAVQENNLRVIARRLLWSGAVLLTVMIGGTVGYYLISEGSCSLLDCFYMTIITITTIGFSEVVNVSGSTFGRIFTIAIAFSGIGSATFILSTLTAFIVEGDINRSFKRKKMEKKIQKCSDHYLVCGCGRVGLHVIDELYLTERSMVVVDIDEEQIIERILSQYPEIPYVVGDATADEVLIAAGIERAAGLFATTQDDNLSLMLTLSARQLNPGLRIISHCRDVRSMPKMRKAGANAVVPSQHIAGLRMASEMIRPKVVTFLDKMLRDRAHNLRIEEISLPDDAPPTTLRELKIERLKNLMVLAIRDGDELIYNPQENVALDSGSTLIVMTSPDDRLKLVKTVVDLSPA